MQGLASSVQLCLQYYYLKKINIGIVLQNLVMYTNSFGIFKLDEICSSEKSILRKKRTI